MRERPIQAKSPRRQSYSRLSPTGHGRTPNFGHGYSVSSSNGQRINIVTERNGSTTREYQIIPQPLQLQTSDQRAGLYGFKNQHSDSYESTSSIVSSPTSSSTARLEQDRQTSPLIITPADSPVSFETYNSQHDLPASAYVDQQRSVGDVHQRNNGYNQDNPSRPIATALAGLDIQYSHDARRPAQEIELISPHGPSPDRHLGYPQISGPWNGHPFRSGDPNVLTRHRLPGIPLSPQDLALSPLDSGDRGGKRKGPLSSDQRKDANDVRQVGACLRCTIMREKCNKERPCNNCHKKLGNSKARKWKLGCVQHRLEACTTWLFPDFVSAAFLRVNVNKFTHGHCYWYHEHKPFFLRFDIGLGLPLELQVKGIEHVAPHDTRLLGHDVVGDSDQQEVGFFAMWDAPVALYYANLDKGIQVIRVVLRRWLDEIFDHQHSDEPWPWPLFREKSQYWEGEMLELIHAYYRPDLESHRCLRKALCLPYFHYLLINMFQVDQRDLPVLYQNISQEWPSWLTEKNAVVPMTVDAFIKMIVMHLARDAAKEVLKSLHDILLAVANPKDTSPGKADLAFCLSFLLLLYLARTQVSVSDRESILIEEGSRDRIDCDPRFVIAEMETNLAEYISGFHEYAWLRHRQQSSIDINRTDEFEQHAQHFGLTEKFKSLSEGKYALFKPTSFDLIPLPADIFRGTNTRRLCWKLLETLNA